MTCKSFAAPLVALVGLSAIACGGADDANEIAGAQAQDGAPEAAPAAKPANRAPVIERVRLVPDEVEPGGTLEAIVSASDPDGHDVTLGFVWTLDGDRIAGGGLNIQVPGHARRNGVVLVSVTATDGAATSEATRASADVANTAPEWRELSLDVEGEILRGEEITILAAADDHDTDEVEFDVRWFANDKELDALGTRLATDRLKRGDVVYAVVTVSDGNLESDERETGTVTIGNAKPTIVSAPGTLRQDGRFEYQLEVKDPDGDRRFRYELASAPPGMEVDSLGEITWQATAVHVGTHRIEVVATDYFGGEGRQQFDLTVSTHTEQAAPAKLEE